MRSVCEYLRKQVVDGVSTDEWRVIWCSQKGLRKFVNLLERAQQKLPKVDTIVEQDDAISDAEMDTIWKAVKAWLECHQAPDWAKMMSSSGIRELVTAYDDFVRDVAEESGFESQEVTDLCNEFWACQFGCGDFL